jgi:hypothetical protein
LERFCLFQATKEQNKTFLFLKKWYQNETKTFQIAPGLLKDRTKLLIILKKNLETDQNKSFRTKNSSTK